MSARATRIALSLLLTAAAGALLAATIYWTLFDPRWVIFLGGVLFAAMASLASRASHAEWRLARRSRQLEQLRSRIAELQGDAVRLRGLAEAVYAPLLIVDREQVCRFHNRAAADKMGGKDAAVDGRKLREAIGEDVYRVLQPRIEGSHAGESGTYDVAWGVTRYRVRQHPCGSELCLLFMPLPSVVQEPSSAPSGQGEALYLHAMGRELTGWDDPKGKLARALEDDQFLLLQQRIVPLEFGGEDPLVYEVLLRLKEEEENLLPPGSFLPEAERFGMMEDLDRWVVRHLVGRSLERLRAQPAWQLPLYCINLSEAAIRSEGFAKFVQSQVEARRFSGRALCFEIGEHDLIRFPEDVARLAAALRPYGCRFTVDAFGSVKGSFAPLRDGIFQFVKIDAVIVQNILRDPTQLARLRAIHAVCCKVGMRSIAEFVEERETLSALRKIGVHFVQGFGIERPQPLQS